MSTQVKTKRKIGTLINEDLLQRAKKYAAENGKALNQLIEEALESYLHIQSGGKTLSLDEVLDAEPGSRSAEGSGRGAGVGYPDFA